jgi:hypothetical protein
LGAGFRVSPEPSPCSGSGLGHHTDARWYPPKGTRMPWAGAHSDHSGWHHLSTLSAPPILH